MNIHAVLHPLWKLSHLIIEWRNYLSLWSTSAGSYLTIFPKANRGDPDQAALTRAAWSGSTLFAIFGPLYIFKHKWVKRSNFKLSYFFKFKCTSNFFMLATVWTMGAAWSRSILQTSMGYRVKHHSNSFLENISLGVDSSPFKVWPTIQQSPYSGSLCVTSQKISD